MKKSTREAIRFLNQEYGIDEALAYAYLSAATDFEVSQVVDRTKGIHAMIRKADFKEFNQPEKADKWEKRENIDEDIFSCP